MAFLNPDQISLGVVSPTYHNADVAGDVFNPGDRSFIHVKNGSGSSVTVTVHDPNSTGPTGAYAFNANIVSVIAPGNEKMVGPFSSSRFADIDGYVHVSYTSVTSVTVGVFTLSSVAM